MRPDCPFTESLEDVLYVCSLPSLPRIGNQIKEKEGCCCDCCPVGALPNGEVLPPKAVVPPNGVVPLAAEGNGLVPAPAPAPRPLPAPAPPPKLLNMDARNGFAPPTAPPNPVICGRSPVPRLDPAPNALPNAPVGWEPNPNVPNPVGWELNPVGWELNPVGWEPNPPPNALP